MWLARARGLLWISALLVGLMAAPVGAQDDQASSFTPAEEEAIRQLVRDYLLANPEVLIEAAQVLSRSSAGDCNSNRFEPDPGYARREELNSDPGFAGRR